MVIQKTGGLIPSKPEVEFSTGKVSVVLCHQSEEKFCSVTHVKPSDSLLKHPQDDDSFSASVIKISFSFQKTIYNFVTGLPVFCLMCFQSIKGNHACMLWVMQAMWAVWTCLFSKRKHYETLQKKHWTKSVRSVLKFFNWFTLVYVGKWLTSFGFAFVYGIELLN